MLPPSRKHPPHSEMEREAKQKRVYNPIKNVFFLMGVLQLIDFQ